MSQVRRVTKEGWQPHPEREKRLASAIAIADALAGRRDLYDRHQREILSIVCWKATEIDGKRRTRYRTTGVVGADLGSPMQHEHVVPRNEMVDMLLRFPTDCAQILSSAVGCLVTPAEHRRLESAGADRFGWDRYRAVGLEVLDMKSRLALDLDEADRRLRKKLGRFRRPSTG